VVTAVSTAASTYITAMSTAGVVPVIYHRPDKGATSGGLSAPIHVGQASGVPAFLRSRRT
jgi:hypothetical protein